MHEKIIKIKVKSDSMDDIRNIVSDIKGTLKQKKYLSTWTEVKRIWIIDYEKRKLYLKRSKSRKRDNGV